MKINLKEYSPELREYLLRLVRNGQTIPHPSFALLTTNFEFLVELTDIASVVGNHSFLKNLDRYERRIQEKNKPLDESDDSNKSKTPKEEKRKATIGLKNNDIKEGSKISVVVNRYERSSIARAVCLKHYGYRCSVCDILPEDIYGKEAATMVHVHHLKPISEISEEYFIDPIRDLRPVCPNCHSFIHLFRPNLTIDDARTKIRKKKN